MHRHQIDGVERVDDGIRFVAERELFQVVGDPRERRVAAVLNAADERPQLLQILARLPAPRAACLERVRRLAQNRVEQLRRRGEVHLREPARQRLADAGEHGAILNLERLIRRWRVDRRQRLREPRSERGDRPIGQPQDA